MAFALNRALDSLVGRIERTEALDPAADKLADIAGKTIGSSALVRRLLSGTDAGHPVHPAIVAVPMGSWVAASYLDAAGGTGGRGAARALVGLGIVSAVPASLTGASDWSYTTGAERRVGFVHAMANYAALALYGGSWFARRRDHHTTGAALSAAGLSLIGVTGWLGGHLAYARGVGVDTTAFQVMPDEWTDVIPEADLVDEQPTLVHADGVPILLVRHDGALEAIGDRCTHRGGPLHEGEFADGCIVCPWHGAKFSVADGQVLDGPATRSQPSYEVRTRYGSVQVRLTGEPGSLRTNPVS